jgi:GT2 family glycosyltransferase
VGIGWVVLTMGNRPVELRRAVASLTDQLTPSQVVIFVNGGDREAVRAEFAEVACVRVVSSPSNLGVPGGRNAGLAELGPDVDVVGFLDDDARLPAGAPQKILDVFDADPRLGAVSLRLVDEDRETLRRHVPRRGKAGVDESGEVGTFLGGACAIRREAYVEVGGYFTELFYGHEELELSWRMIDGAWKIWYLSDVEVYHPKTDIARHADGWRLTGRNRVWIARRTLPWPIALIHAIAWFGLGAARAPSGCRRGYVSGWRSGWNDDVGRAPISWSGVWQLGRLGRLPIC